MFCFGVGLIANTTSNNVIASFGASKRFYKEN